MIMDTEHNIISGLSIKKAQHPSKLNKLLAAVVERMVIQNIYIQEPSCR